MRFLFLVATLVFVVGCGPQKSAIYWQNTTDSVVLAPPSTQAVYEYPFFEHPKFSVQGHRGARAIYPENTIPAFDYALSVGVNQIELDIHLTKDGVPVIHHDAKVSNRRCLARGGKKIKAPIPLLSLTAEQVRDFDCGTIQKKGQPKHIVPGARIPTFAEVIELVLNSPHPAAKDVIFKVDIKSENDRNLYPSQEVIAETVLKMTHHYGIQNRCIYSSFDRKLLAALRAQHKESRLALLQAGPLGKKLIAEAQALEVETVSPVYLMLNLQGPKKWTKRLHDLGFRVVPWTVNKPNSWKTMIEAGVDGIITDDPEGLIKYYSEHSSAGGKLNPTPQELDEEIELSEDQVQEFLSRQ